MNYNKWCFCLVLLLYFFMSGCSANIKREPSTGEITDIGFSIPPEVINLISCVKLRHDYQKRGKEPPPCH